MSARRRTVALTFSRRLAGRLSMADDEKKWSGMVARTDPIKAAKEARAKQYRNDFEANVAKREYRIEQLRELREELAYRTKGVRDQDQE